MNGLIIIALVAALACANGAPTDSTTTPVAILKYAHEGPHPDGSYSFNYETADGTSFQEQGQLKEVGARDAKDDGETGAAVVADGAFSFVAPDGTQYAVKYTADENGFHPEGEHLPVGPAIPEGIARALEWIAAHPQPEEKKRF